MSSGILLSFSALSSLSPSVQTEIMDYIKSQTGTDDPGSRAAPTEDDEEPADLSGAQARKFLERCSEKTRDALRAIAQADAAGFKMSQVATALKIDLKEGDLRGVWGGITKRARTVLGDPEAYLIWWVEDGDDWAGRVSAMTHRSLRKAFDL